MGTYGHLHACEHARTLVHSPQMPRRIQIGIRAPVRSDLPCHNQTSDTSFTLMRNKYANGSHEMYIHMPRPLPPSQERKPSLDLVRQGQGPIRLQTHRRRHIACSAVVVHPRKARAWRCFMSVTEERRRLAIQRVIRTKTADAILRRRCLRDPKKRQMAMRRFLCHRRPFQSQT